MHPPSPPPCTSPRSILDHFAVPLHEELKDIARLPRNVSFADNVEVFEFDDENDDDDNTWWTMTELNESRLQARSLACSRAQDTTHPSHSRVLLLELSYRKTTLILDSDFASLLKLSASTPDQDLRLWQKCNLRGLERFVSAEYGLGRCKDVVRTRRAVFRVQSAHAGAPDLAERIATRCREETRRARTFALFLGEADASRLDVIPTGGRRKRSKIMPPPTTTTVTA